MSRAVEKGDEKAVKLLLDNGAQLNFEDESGQTPLLRAVNGESPAIVQLLLAREVNLDYKNHIVRPLL